MPNPTPKQAWTQEPWTVRQCSEAKSDKNEACGLNDRGFDSSRDECGHWAPLDDLTRAVSCVNALSGIKDPAAYLGALRNVANLAKVVNSKPSAEVLASLWTALSALRKQEQP